MKTSKEALMLKLQVVKNKGKISLLEKKHDDNQSQLNGMKIDIDTKSREIEELISQNDTS